MPGVVTKHRIQDQRPNDEFGVLTTGDHVETLFKKVWDASTHLHSHWLKWEPLTGKWGAGKTSNLKNLYVVSSLAKLDEHCEVVKKLEGERPTRFLVAFQEGDDEPQSLIDTAIRLQVRNSDRFHVARFGSATQFQELLSRFLHGLAHDHDDDSILDAHWENNELVVRSATLDVLRIPLEKLQTVRQADVADWEVMQFDENGEYIEWTSLDVHMGWSQLQQLVDPIARLKAHQSSVQFNARYGAAIKSFREEVKKSQSTIDGLDERTIRRIESGNTRVTSQAIEKLAAAHGLSPNAYMAEVAKHLEPEPKLKNVAAALLHGRAAKRARSR